ncbi:MAG: hypothetical protein FWH23_01430 [Bacteroidales bacterium]|nr:hypothetical protein [Bacteroidales bacterium]MCL2133319.1 hypothetical protein [Bacteroidales bacterium]
MKQRFISIIFLTGFVLFGHIAAAQNKIDPTVEIITDYQGKVAEADRIGLSYTADSLTNVKPSFSYQALPPVLNNKFTMQPIPAARMNIPTSLQDDKRCYFRGSLSYPFMPDLNFYLNTYFRGNTYFNLYANHQSFRGKVPLYNEALQTTDPIPSEIIGNNSNTRIGAALQHFWDNVAINLNVEYENRFLIYHGQDTSLLQQVAGTDYIDKISDDSYMRDKQSQVFHIFRGGISLFSVNRNNNNTKFKVDANFNYIKERAHIEGFDPTAQTLLGAKAWLNHHLADEHAIDVEIGVKTFNRPFSGTSDILLHLAPCYQYSDNGWLFTAGVNLEGLNSNSNFALNVYPKMAVSYKADDWFIPYATVIGGTRLNNYEKIITENPYILPGIEVANSRYLIDIQGGIRGSINPYLSYQLSVGYSTIDSMYFFVNSDAPLFNDGVALGPLRSNFDVMYDNIKLLTFGGAVSSKLGAFEALIKMQYYRYMLNDDNKAWHRPNLEFGANLRYTIAKRFILNVDGYFRGETPILLSLNHASTTTAAPSYLNLGAMAEYIINKQISAFVQATNLLNNNYQQYYLYYNPGITVGAGVSIAF